MKTPTAVTGKTCQRGSISRCPAVNTSTRASRRWFVGERDQPARRRDGVDEAQRARRGAFAEQALAGAEHDRMNHEPVLVDELMPDQRRCKSRRADDNEVLPWLLLQAGDLGGDVVD